MSLPSQERKDSRFVLSPVLRSIYTWGTILQLVFLLTFMALGVFTPLTWLIVLSLLQIHAKYRWLQSLPFSARKLFAWIALPPAIVIVIGCLINILIDTDHPLSARERSVEIALLLTLFYAMLFLCELPGWRRLSRLLTIRWGAALLWTPFALTILAWFVVPLRNRDIQHLAGWLPAQPWQLAALSLLAVIAIYWLAEKAFAERENRPSIAGRTAQQPL